MSKEQGYSRLPNDNALLKLHPNMARNNAMLQSFTGKRVFDRNKSKFNHSFKDALWQASNRQCAYCGLLIEIYANSRVDHFEPKSLFDNENIENYICACVLCNSIKGNGEIEQFRFRLAFYRSEYRGIISPAQALILVNMGIQFPIETELFHFEKVIIAGSQHE